MQNFGDGTVSANDIAITINGNNNQVLGCYIGVGSDGITQGTKTFAGIQITGASNLVGDGTAAAAITQGRLWSRASPIACSGPWYRGRETQKYTRPCPLNGGLPVSVRHARRRTNRCWPSLNGIDYGLPGAMQATVPRLERAHKAPARAQMLRTANVSRACLPSAEAWRRWPRTQRRDWRQRRPQPPS